MTREFHEDEDWLALGECQRIGLMRVNRGQGGETFSFEYDPKWLAGNDMLLLDSETDSLSLELVKVVAEFLRVDENQADEIAEDLSRICRRMHAIIFCENAEDTRTRVIAINDYVDTANENWKQASIFASFKNESFCNDTAARITRSLRNRFHGRKKDEACRDRRSAGRDQN